MLVLNLPLTWKSTENRATVLHSCSTSINSNLISLLLSMAQQSCFVERKPPLIIYVSMHVTVNSNVIAQEEFLLHQFQHFLTSILSCFIRQESSKRFYFYQQIVCFKQFSLTKKIKMFFLTTTSSSCSQGYSPLQKYFSNKILFNMCFKNV